MYLNPNLFSPRVINKANMSGDSEIKSVMEMQWRSCAGLQIERSGRSALIFINSKLHVKSIIQYCVCVCVCVSVCV